MNDPYAKLTKPCIVIQHCVYSRNAGYSWTALNDVGGSFGIGSFKSLKAAVASAKTSYSGVTVYLNRVDWNYETDSAIDNIEVLK
jgi:hypothetical protein